MKTPKHSFFYSHRRIACRPHLGLLAFVVLAAGAGHATAAPKYFDVTAGAGNGVGGSGTLAAQTTALYSTTAAGDGTLVAAVAADDGIFQGTAGTVTFGAAYTLNSATFNITNYVLTTSSTTGRIFSAPITLAANVNLNFIEATQTADRTLGIASVSGGTGSTLTIQGAQTGTAASRINLSVANANVSVPTTISGAGTSLAGYVSVVNGAQVTNTITNNSGFTTLLGATSGNDLTLGSAAVISGSAGVQFSAGGSGGAGTITLNSNSSYTGQTILNGTASGAVKLGVDNALPTTTAVVMGFSTGNGQKLDLNGHNQTIGSLASNTGGTGSITSSATGTGTDTLTIKGAATTSFGLVIADGSTRKVGLTLDAGNTGSQTLTVANTYSGPSSVAGGTLVISSAGNINGSTSVSVSNMGALTLQNATALADTGTLNLTGSGTTVNLNAASGTSETISALTLNGTPVNQGTYTYDVLNSMAMSDGITNNPFTSLNGETLTITPVPEPATVFAGLLIVGALGWNQRRRLGGLVGLPRTA